MNNNDYLGSACELSLTSKNKVVVRKIKGARDPSTGIGRLPETVRDPRLLSILIESRRGSIEKKGSSKPWRSTGLVK
jgi:hypothetical protein